MKYVLYGHGGSRNHGCEAIVRTTTAMLGNELPVDVYTSDLDGDRKYGTTEIASFHPYRELKSSKPARIYCGVMHKYFHNYDPMTRFELGEALKEKGDIFLSVGGDNYCNGRPGKHSSRNKLFSRDNKTVLWGCSITPELLKEKAVVEDMNRYSLITARESLTYQALIDAGVKTKTALIPDPAFTLKKQAVDLPDSFIPGNTVGINVSPMVIRLEKASELLYANICRLVDDILAKTDMNVALIPHVIWKMSDDTEPLKKLYAQYKETGRVCLIDPEQKMNAMELKYVISQCRFMVAARTHASIAAYSTCVPTLVIGYSVKSKGIAKDLFGTTDGYVIPADTITSEADISQVFFSLKDKEDAVRTRLQTIIPDFIARAYTAADLVRQLKDSM